MKIEEYIELSIQDILEARVGITDAVVRYRDRLTVKGDAWIYCHALPIERMSNNHNLYKSTLELVAVSKSQEDLRSNSLDNLVAELNDEINNDLTIVTLQAALDAIDVSSGIAFNGLVPMPGSEADGEYQQFMTSTDIFLTYTP
jgi:hypothetical protein